MTLENIKQTLKDNILKGEGENTITLTEAALDQMKQIVDRMKSITGYSEENINDEMLANASMVAEMYNTDLITGEVIDGQLQPMPNDVFSIMLDSMVIASGRITYSMVVICDLLWQILSEIKQFKR